MDPDHGKETLRVFAEQWFAYLDRVHERESTVKTYKTHMRVHIVPFIGHVPAKELRRPTSNAFVEHLAGKGLAASYVEGIFKTFKIFVNWLTREQEVPLPGNIVAGIKLPPVPDRVEVVLTPEEVTRLADCIDPRYEIMVWLAACAGLRLGECVGLTRARVNFTECKLYVEKQGQGGKEVKLKTNASYATLPVDHFLIRNIAQHMVRFPGADPVGDDAVRKRRYSGYQPPANSGLVIVNSDGRPVQRQGFNKIWQVAVEKAGLPKGTRFHDLKHFYTTRLGAAGHDRKTVQALSRHSDPSMTDRYAHPPEAVEGLKIKAFGALFDPGSGRREANRRRGLAR
ncbi:MULTISPECIES: tyrosine-type recombinase/integrase [unclassified Kitasatospora]|uniref:tyrosine-type recombinase/integrase n=1 Tax=unclassified Kitasatospora TaxID=2633591 RepID=UPI0024748D30|nr:site-specific integrase [Kitasatospora sp. MAP12-44]